VTVLSTDPGLRRALDGLEVMVMENPAPEAGISHSIALGIAALPREADAVLIGVADQPSLTSSGLCALIEAFRPGMMVVPRYGDHRGNPAVFDRRFFTELAQLAGDRGGQQVIAAHPDAVIEVQLPEAMGIDIDRLDDWPANRGRP
jgi:molybdenum cofactor cytidylyltransferase